MTDQLAYFPRMDGRYLALTLPATSPTVSRTETQTPQALHEKGPQHRDTCGVVDDACDGDIFNEASNGLNGRFHDTLGDTDVTGDGIKMIKFDLVDEKNGLLMGKELQSSYVNSQCQD